MLSVYIESNARKNLHINLIDFLYIYTFTFWIWCLHHVWKKLKRGQKGIFHKSADWVEEGDSIIKLGIVYRHIISQNRSLHRSAVIRPVAPPPVPMWTAAGSSLNVRGRTNKTLNVHVLQTLRWHCSKNQPDSIKDSITWAQELKKKS